MNTSLPMLVGNTPLLALDRFSKKHALQRPLLAKLEMFNPLSSVKDRVALALIEDAEVRGALKPGGTLVEATSGNTGIGLAYIAASKGYELVLTMPDTMSVERRRILTRLGATLVLTPGALGMSGAVEKAEELLKTIEGAVAAGQFTNPANPLCHERTTAEELWRDAGGGIDAFVACVGTGGTIMGVGRGLRARNPHVKIVAVEPASSPVLSGGKPGKHAIQGIGAGFVPDIVDLTLLDEIVTVTDEEAFSAVAELGRIEGLLAGISSGAAAFAAARYALAHPEERVATLFPDTGERYLSMALPGEGGES